MRDKRLGSTGRAAGLDGRPRSEAPLSNERCTDRGTGRKTGYTRMNPMPSPAHGGDDAGLVRACLVTSRFPRWESALAARFWLHPVQGPSGSKGPIPSSEGCSADALNTAPISFTICSVRRAKGARKHEAQGRTWSVGRSSRTSVLTHTDFTGVEAMRVRDSSSSSERLPASWYRGRLLRRVSTSGSV